LYIKKRQENEEKNERVRGMFDDVITFKRTKKNIFHEQILFATKTTF
jgi:hypothetical protein